MSQIHGKLMHYQKVFITDQLYFSIVIDIDIQIHVYT